MANKTALITGGSRGIGLAIAQAFGNDGYSVIIAARNKDELSEAKKTIQGDAMTIVMDVGDTNSVRNGLKDLSSLDILVNAAGVIEPIGPIEKVDAEKWLNLLKINVFGTFVVTQACIPLLSQSKAGVVINFVGGGEGAFPNFSAYASSKGAIARFTETAAAELQMKNITVNAIAPGAVNTKMTEDMIAAGTEAGEQYHRAIKQQESEATPEKAVQLVRWLCSEDARKVTGKIISAQWDKYEEFPEHIEDIVGTDTFTIRRVRPKDRGFSW